MCWAARQAFVHEEMSKQLLARVNGAGIGDLANARGYKMQGGVSLKNEKRPPKAFVRKVSFGPQKALLLFCVLFYTCVPFPSPRKGCAISQTQKP